MSSYYELRSIEPRQGAQEDLERRLMARVAQEAQRRLRPVRLKVELEAAQCSDDGSGNSPSMLAAAAAALSPADPAADGSNGGGAASGGASPAALQQALGNASRVGARVSGGGSEGAAPSSQSGDSLLGRHLPRLGRVASQLHLRHTISLANPFRAVRSLSRRPETRSGSGPCTIYEDALLVIGSELLDLHLVSDAASDADEAEASAASAAAGPGIGAGAGSGGAISFTGPAGLRLAKGQELRNRAAGHAEVRAEIGETSISALQKSYSLSVSFAQILAVSVNEDEVTVSYAHNVASRQQNELHFTLQMPSPEDAAKLVNDIRQYICRYLQAMLLLQNNYRLDIACAARLVTLSTTATCGTADERVIAHSPAWGTTVPLQAAAQGGQPSLLRVYSSSPIGGVYADITADLILQHQQGGEEEVKFWVKAQRQPNVEVPKDKDAADKDSSSQGDFVEPGVDHEVQLFVTATPAPVSASAVSGAASPIEPGLTSRLGSLFGFNWLMVASLACALLAIALRHPSLQGGLTAATGPAAADICFMASLATLAASLLHVNLAGRRLLGGLGGRQPAAAVPAAGWNVRLDVAQPVHDPSMADSGSWSDRGVVGEEELTQRGASTDEARSSEATEPSQDGPFGRFTADEEKRFLTGVNANKQEALRRLHATAEWRRKKGIDTILEQPQPAFDFAKGMYEHGVPCFTKAGNPVWVDKISDMKKSFADFKASEWGSDDLYRHAAFCEEWLFRRCAPQGFPLGRRLEVVDLKGMRFTDIGSGWFSWMKSLGLFMQEHYPERMSRCFVINSPGFFNVLWRALDPMMTENVKRKVSVVGSDPKAIKALFMQELREKDILEEWGGPNKMRVYDSQYEKELRELVRQLNSRQRRPEQ